MITDKEWMYWLSYKLRTSYSIWRRLEQSKQLSKLVWWYCWVSVRIQDDLFPKFSTLFIVLYHIKAVMVMMKYRDLVYVANACWEDDTVNSLTDHHLGQRTSCSSVTTFSYPNPILRQLHSLVVYVFHHWAMKWYG